MGEIALFSQPDPFYFKEIPLPVATQQASSFCMEMDENGFIWTGSVQGLLRFDGSSLVPPQKQGRQSSSAHVPSVKIQTMLQSHLQQHTLWLGTVEQGLYRFNTETEAAVNYRFQTSNQGSLAGDAVAGLAETADGSIWVGTDHFTLNCLRPGQQNFEHFKPQFPAGKQVESSDWLGEIVLDTKNPDLLWIGSKFGVYRFDRASNEFKLFPFEKTEAFWYVQNPVQLFMDDEGTLWVGGVRSGLLRLDQALGQWENWKRWDADDEIYNSNTIFEIQPLDKDRLLIAVTREGLWWFDKKKKELAWLDENKPVWGFTKVQPGRDSAAQFLLSTNDGLELMTSEPFVFPGVNFQQSNPKLTHFNWQRAYLLSPGKDTLYMGTMHGDGLLVMDLHTRQISAVRYHKQQTALATDVYYDELCQDDHGKLWVGTDEGLLFVNKNASGKTVDWRIEPFLAVGNDPLILQKKHIQALACQDGWLWVGTKNDGLYRVRLADGAAEQLSGQAIGVPDNHIRKLFVDKDERLWVGSDRGLFLLDAAKDVFVKNDVVSVAVNDMEQDGEGRLWLGTLGDGLQRLDFRQPATDQLAVFKNDGLLGGDVVFDIKIAQDGRVWLHAQSGLAIYDPANGYFINYDMRDNVPSKIGPLEELPDGSMVSATKFGFALLPPTFGKTLGTHFPKPYLKGLRLLNGEKVWSPPFSAAIKLEHDENHLAFEMGAVWIDANPAVYYQYKLDGFDSDWVYAADRTFVSYNSLPPGHYRFTFRAGNRPGLWSPPMDGFDMVIHPAFYQTGWFKLLILLALSTLIWGVYQLRMRQVKREATFRQRLAEVRHDALRAQMNPHFLSNCLNAIQWFIIKKRPTEALNYLTKFSRLVRAVLDQSQRQHISLEEEIKTLKYYLDMESIRFENHFEASLQVDEGLDQGKVQMPPMLLQPLVENAIRHGLLPAEKPGKLSIQIYGDGTSLTCVVEDNGIGRAAAVDKKKPIDGKTSQGLKLAAERLSLMGSGASLIFHDLMDENGQPSGTKVVLTLPLEK